MLPELQHKNIVFFDGVCQFCQGSVQFIIKNNPAENLFFASLQSDVAKTILTEKTDLELLPDSIVLYKSGEIFIYSDAILEIASYLSYPWKLAVVFKFIPRFIRDYVYKAFAKRRYAFFGKTESCMLPNPEQRLRFL